MTNLTCQLFSRQRTWHEARFRHRQVATRQDIIINAESVDENSEDRESPAHGKHRAQRVRHHTVRCRAFHVRCCPKVALRVPHTHHD